MKYTPPSHLEIPGLEAILEYGDASKVKHDRIPGAMLINDQSQLDRARITSLDGLHDDPEASESRQPNADRHGEQSGAMLYRGRTVGLTGRVEAGNIGAMRSNWRRLRSQFGVVEKDLLVHHPFEVRALRNEVLNPDLSTDAVGWDTPILTAGSGTLTGPTSVSDGVSNVGQVAVASAVGAGSLIQRANLWPILAGAAGTGDPLVPKWNGEDVWITARCKVQSASVAPTSLALGLAQWPGVGIIGGPSIDQSLTAQSITSPATGTWYRLSARILASSLKDMARYLTPTILLAWGASGSFTIRFSQTALVLLDPDEPTPAAYFAGNMSGFSYTGAARKSASIGPTHAYNKVADPRFEVLGSDGAALLNWSYYSSSLTINQVPIRSQRWVGDHVDASVYFKSTKDNNTASRVMGIIANEAGYGDNQSPVIAQGRLYRWSTKVNLLQRPATGSVMARIAWLDQAGSQIFISIGESLALGESLASIQATAPANAVKAQISIANPATTTALAVLELFVSDPCFVDITDWDPGDFYGVGDVAEEAGSYRRIPRPFLLRKVRKTSDMKAPEQQGRSRAWRDFTMSLRAGDPRVYCLDARRRQFKLPSVAAMKFVAVTGSAFIDTSGGRGGSGGTSSAPAPVPVGFTYEGQSIPSTVAWTTALGPPVIPGTT